MSHLFQASHHCRLQVLLHGHRVCDLGFHCLLHLVPKALDTLFELIFILHVRKMLAHEITCGVDKLALLNSLAASLDFVRVRGALIWVSFAHVAS